MRNVERLVDEFENNPSAVAKTMRDWIETDPAAFCQQATPVLRHMKDGPGYRHLLWVISATKILARVLCDPALLSEEEACALAHKLRKIDPSVEMNLVKEIFGVDGIGGMSLADPASGLRFLSIFSTEANGVHLLPVVSRLLRHPNATIRSKATTILGKLSRDYDWLEQTKNDGDDRVRANALEALWEPGIPDRLRARLWEGVSDSSNRVVGNALLGLYRQGEAGCIPLIVSMTSHSEEKFRATAAWVIGETGDDRFRECLSPLLEESSLLVRRNALQATQKLDVRAAFAGIERLQLVMFSKEPGATAREAASPSSGQASAQESPAVQSHVFHIAAVSQHGSPVSGLLPTDFRIARDSGLLTHYTLHHEPPPDTMSIAFALPNSDAAGNRLSNKWRAFLSNFFKQKRHLDYWAFLEYTDLGASVARTNQTYGPVRDLPAVGASRNGLSSYGQISPPEKAAFIRNFVELDDFLTARMPANRSYQLSSVLDLLLTPPPFLRNGVPAPKRALHAVVVESPGSREIPQQRVEALKQTALNRGFLIHLISANTSSALAELPAATGGAFLVCQDDVDSWTRQLTMLYASLFSTYRLEFESGAAETAQSAKIRVVVRKGPLFGELRTTCTVRDEVCVPA